MTDGTRTVSRDNRRTPNGATGALMAVMVAGGVKGPLRYGLLIVDT